MEAGSTVKEFVAGVFFPDAERRLSRATSKLYRNMWKLIGPYLGDLRLRDVRVVDVQGALNALESSRRDELSHAVYMTVKVTCSAIFAQAMRLGHHPGPNPVTGTTVRGYGHNNHRRNGAYTLAEIRQLLTMFPGGQLAVAIGINAFLALRGPEVEALMPEDFDGDRVRIHRRTKTGNDEWIPVVAPLKRLLANGWQPIRLPAAEKTIKKVLRGGGVEWKGWYAFRRGMATNLFRLGVPAEVAALILRNSPEVVRAHYLKLEQVGEKQNAMALLEEAFDRCAVTVQ